MGANFASETSPTGAMLLIMPNGPWYTHFWTTDAAGERLPKPTYYAEGVAFFAYGADGPGLVPVYRWLDEARGYHFWTTHPQGELLDRNTWRAEGVAFWAPAGDVPGAVPVYRFYDRAGHHFWTTDPNGEKLPDTFHSEGIAFHSLPNADAGGVPVWRYFSKQNEVGRIIQEGMGFKEMVVDGEWHWVATYINLNIAARIGAPPGRRFEIASGFVLPWNEVGPNRQMGEGYIDVGLGPLGAVYVRSVDGAPLAIGYRELRVNVAWQTPQINF